MRPPERQSHRSYPCSRIRGVIEKAVERAVLTNRSVLDILRQQIGTRDDLGFILQIQEIVVVNLRRDSITFIADDAIAIISGGFAGIAEKRDASDLINE